MKKRHVLATKNLPKSLPVQSTIVAWLALDHIKAPGWAWGVSGTIVVIGWVCSLFLVFTQKEIDIINPEKSTKKAG